MVYVTALASTEVKQGQAKCGAFSTHVKTVSLGGGIIADSRVELINVKPEIGKKSGLLNEEVLVPIKNLEIQSVRSICPEGRRCDEYGSIVKVSGPIGDGCDREGPSGYNVKKNLDGSVQLNVIAYKFANNELRACPEILKTFQKEIFLPMTFVDINHVKLNVLK